MEGACLEKGGNQGKNGNSSEISQDASDKI